METEENNNMCEDKETNSQVLKKKIKKKKKVKTQNDDEKRKRRKTNRRIIWNFLEHNGPLLPPAYKPLPEIPFFYNGNKTNLSAKTEEVATFYAKLLNNYNTEEKTFHENFFNDWREIMTDEEKAIIEDLNKCNFRYIFNYFNQERKLFNRNELRKKKVKANEDMLKKHHGFCSVDGEIQEIDQFRIGPPGLFRGRGDHPKLGKVKRRVQPEDITINCSSDSKIPEAPEGHQWKEVVHDNTVTWLAKWTDCVAGEDRYINLSSCSKVKIEEDKKKFSTAKLLDGEIDRIRRQYTEDMDSKDLETKQRAVALYLIDKIGLRIGNEKDEDKADTVGCCSLRVEHVALREKNLVLDFLGKDSIHYYNEIFVEEKVFRNLLLFQKDKTKDSHLFDCLTTTKLNEYLNKQMEGLTAKVFRTYNASLIFETFLNIFTVPKSFRSDKIKSHKCANLAVALLLNHRTVPKTPLLGKEERITEIKQELQATLQKIEESESEEIEVAKAKLFQDLRGLLFKNKEISLETSKTSYLDPRITVAWCQKNYIEAGKIYTRKIDRKRFKWAIEVEDKEFFFSEKNKDRFESEYRQEV